MQERRPDSHPQTSSGGETVILKPSTLDFWGGFQPGRGLELADLVELVPPRFNQLTVGRRGAALKTQANLLACRAARAPKERRGGAGGLFALATCLRIEASRVLRHRKQARARAFDGQRLPPPLAPPSPALGSRSFLTRGCLTECAPSTARATP